MHKPWPNRSPVNVCEGRDKRGRKEAYSQLGGPHFSYDSPSRLKASSPQAPYTRDHWNWWREGSICQLLFMGQVFWCIVILILEARHLRPREAK